MNLVSGAMRRPVTIIVSIVAVVLCAFVALRQMPRDILPTLGIPVIYVAQPFGGMDPAQMEGYLTYYFEYHFLYITGIEHVESKSIQGIALIKLQFHPGTNMAAALAETVSYVNRARAFMPVGTPPPPFGGAPRTVVVSADPDRLRAYGMSPEEIVTALTKGNVISPSGNVRISNMIPMVPVNSVIGDVRGLGDVPIRSEGTRTIFIRDIGTVEDSSDVETGYAVVNGRHTVYIPVTKRADASTLSVVNLVKENLPKFQSVLPEGVKVSYQFDQSPYVSRAIRGLTEEGILGALLTGLMVLLFLRDWRTALVVVVNIPLAILAAAIALWASGLTVNMMTLGGLALAVGILVDEATVVVENVHSHRGQRQSLPQA